MAIIWKNGALITHEGVVVRVFAREQKVMSDVYSMVGYATVYESGSFVDLRIGDEFTHADSQGVAAVDASHQVMALWASFEQEKMEELRKTDRENSRKATEEFDKNWVLTPSKGRRVRVVGGRKVPKGTEGEVFWKDGDRLGLKDPNGNTHWVDARYCVAVWDEFPYGGAPFCGWSAFKEHLLFQKEVRRLALPDVKARDMVTLESGVTGPVFWRRDENIGVGVGVEVDSQGRFVNKVWSHLEEVTQVNGAPVGEKPPVVPMPFSLVREIKEGRALTAEGEFIMDLDETTALSIYNLAPTLVVRTPAPSP
jgi:hypothetical protein